MSTPIVQLIGITKRYGDAVACEAVSLAIEEGQFVVLLGPSGSGKTTLLSILGGFTEPTEGQVMIAGEDVSLVPPAHRPTTTVFQDYALFPHMSVAGNIGFGLAMKRVSKSKRRAKVEQALAIVGLDGFGHRRVHELSGGQRQRVALARAIVVDPKVLLLDEPLGALDLNLRRKMQEELLHIQRRLGTTFVHVTHDQDEAMNIADLIVVLNNGYVEDIGPPDRIYLRPATQFVATFMGESNVLEACVVGSDDGSVIVETAFGRLLIEGKGVAQDGKAVTLSIRPEQIATDEADGLVPFAEVQVTERSFNGAHLRCHASAGAESKHDLIFHLPARSRVAPGDRIALFVRPSDVVILRQ